MKVILCLLLAVVTASGEYVSEFSELELQAYREVKALYDVLRQVGREGVDEVDPSLSEKKKKEHVTLGKFSYSNCADPSTEIVVPANLSINPDPIKIPGVIVASGSVSAKKPFGSPVKADLEVWKEVFGVWVKAPCIDQFGSCNYDDFCTILNSPTCPPEFVKIGLNCKCPFTAGSWVVPPVSINVTSSLPFAISGAVRAKMSATYEGSLLICLQVQFDLA